MPSSLGEKLQSVPKLWLYVILIISTSVPLFVPIQVPNKPTDASIDLYAKLMEIPEDSTVLIQSDWTKSTRGESGGLFEAMIKILMRRGVKFAVYSAGDPQAAPVARDAVLAINQKGGYNYKRFDNWVSLGFLPNAEAAGQAMANSIFETFKDKTEVNDAGQSRPVFESPVMKGRNEIKDYPLLVIVTASKTSTVAIERLYGRAPALALMVTGVMAPESQVYYASGQIVGLGAGLKGVYDLETLMMHGVNVPGDPKSAVNTRFGEIRGFPDAKDNIGNGTRYYPTLHVALTLLILAVVVGNLGMFLSRMGGRK